MSTKMDPVLRSFLERQFEAALALTAKSDVVKVRPLDPGPVPGTYHALFLCKTLVFDGSEVRETDRAEVGFHFPRDYLEHADPVRTVSVLYPYNLFHPNILGPIICVGRMKPGTELIDLVYQVYEILTFQKRATHDSLNKRAAQWCRNHQDRLPLDRRPLKRRSIQIEGEVEETGAKEA